jgi:hypothetical protein
MNTRNLATAAAVVLTMAACSPATVTAWLLVTSPTTVALTFYQAFAQIARYL